MYSPLDGSTEIKPKLLNLPPLKNAYNTSLLASLGSDLPSSSSSSRARDSTGTSTPKSTNVRLLTSGSARNSSGNSRVAHSRISLALQVCCLPSRADWLIALGNRMPMTVLNMLASGSHKLLEETMHLDDLVVWWSLGPGLEKETRVEGAEFGDLPRASCCSDIL